jgi:cytochrome c-type biogenesis protein
MSTKTFSRRFGAGWWQVTLVGFVIAAGYFGFRIFALIPDMGALNLYFLAVTAGVASFFSPCAFPLLPTYFSFYHQARQNEAHLPAAKASNLQLGMAAALGVITFNLLLGLIIATLGAGMAKSSSISSEASGQLVRIFRGAVGAILLLLGIAQFAGWTLKPRFVDAFAFRTRPLRDSARSLWRGLYFYGLGYNAAGMGCTGPILAGLIIAALSSGGFVPALIAFGIFSLTMGLLMLLLSALIAASRDKLIARLKAATPKIKLGSSIVLVLVGLFNIYTTINLELFFRTFFP